MFSRDTTILLSFALIPLFMIMTAAGVNSQNINLILFGAGALAFDLATFFYWGTHSDSKED